MIKTPYVFLFVVIGIVIFLSSQEEKREPESVKQTVELKEKTGEQMEVSKTFIFDEAGEKPVHALLGATESEIISEFGEPDRRDLSAYDYVWSVYEQNEERYIQFGFFEGKVVTVLALGTELLTFPFQMNEPLSEQVQANVLQGDVEVRTQGELVELHVDEQNTRYKLVSVGKHWASLYVDHVTNKLVAVRYLDSETLIKQKAFDMVYRGKLIEAGPLNEQQMHHVEEGNERQIFTITNIIRKRSGLPALTWHEEVAQTAMAHSKDMKDNHYFSHTSPTQGDLAQRLMKKDVFYAAAGENIAAKYIDGADVVIGWLNSESHRKSLLHPHFTHLGVGVYEQYYTQNFIQSMLP